MTVEADGNWADVWSEFQGLWADLGSEEREAFWRNASKYAYDMNHRSVPYKRLCLALHDVKSGRGVKRANGWIPITPRARSADELQRAVAQHKAELLLVESARRSVLRDLARLRLSAGRVMLRPCNLKLIYCMNWIPPKALPTWRIGFT